ncbi:pentapeptide repeat-containing protein [Micromonospora sp. WMMD737]|uniref:pentapeptide repeat-containing protein n=1 Tax=Micromonospora sp. WMMD737 TaxID=3404113 RepID=UPI003B95A804
MSERPPWYERVKPIMALRKRWSERAADEAKMQMQGKKPEKTPKPRTYKPIHIATLLILSIAALIVTGFAAWLMWDAAKVPASLPSSPELAVREAQLRVDVIRNILAVGAGTGGLIALFLALRRQYVKERVDHADQEYKNRIAEDTKHDAAEKRVTELYVKAAEQLGSEKAAVRLAALYALERVAQDNSEHRQTIVDLICAYLRMPYDVPQHDGIRHVNGKRDEEDEKRHHELQVRLAAQKILTRHLRYSEIVGEGRSRRAAGSPAFWSGIDVDLTGAALTHVNFGGCAVASINMSRARVFGRSEFSEFFCQESGVFSQMRFGGTANFTSAVFDGFICEGSRFDGEAIFHTARLTYSHFIGVAFNRVVSFSGARAFVWEFQGARAAVDVPGNHSWPRDFTLSDEAEEGFGEVLKTTDRGWWEDDSEEPKVSPMTLARSEDDGPGLEEKIPDPESQEQ